MRSLDYENRTLVISSPVLMKSRDYGENERTMDISSTAYRTEKVVLMSMIEYHPSMALFGEDFLKIPWLVLPSWSRTVYAAGSS